MPTGNPEGEISCPLIALKSNALPGSSPNLPCSRGIGPRSRRRSGWSCRAGNPGRPLWRPLPRPAGGDLPPGPPLPRAVQTAIWSRQARKLLFACHERYGDIFTLRIAYEGKWVMLADPEAVKQVFIGDPRIYHAGEGNQILAPILGRNSILVLDEKPHMSQRRLLLPPFH